MRRFPILLAIVLASAHARAQSPILELGGSAPDERLGARVLSPGDVDGDGRPDLAVVHGTPGPATAATQRLAFHRSLDGAVIRTFQGGTSLVGDLDGDGVVDVGVPTVSVTPSGPRYTGLDVLSGSNASVLASWTLWPTGWTALEVRGLDDVDGDGTPDLLFESGAVNGTGFNGWVRVRSGVDGSILAELQLTNPYLIWPAARVIDDLDADGIDDLVIALGSEIRVTSTVGLSLIRTDPLPALARTLVAGGDFDGDGIGDYALSEKISGAETFVRSGANGAVLSQQKGVAVSLDGDFDGNGRSDLVLFVDPVLRSISYTTGSVLFTVRDSWGFLGNEIPPPTVVVPDLDGDGRQDIAVGHPFHPILDGSDDRGRVRVYRTAGLSAWDVGTPFGFGSAAACPCGNVGVGGDGCANSTGRGGRLTAVGSSSVADRDLAIVAQDLPVLVEAILFAGPDVLAGGTGVPFASGRRVVRGPLVRVGTHVPDPFNQLVWGSTQAWTGPASPPSFRPFWSAGQTWRFQVLYADAADPCGNGWNTTSGLEVTFTP